MKDRITFSARRASLAGLLALSCVVAGPAAAAGQATGVEPEAERLLRAATSFLAGQQQFSVDTDSTIEIVLESGQKLQFDHSATLTVQRPNRLRAERRGDLVDQTFYFDGKALTLYNPDAGYYATVPVPGTIEQALDFARDSLDLIAPAGDLVDRNAYSILMDGVTTGFVVGKSVVNGVRCNHLAFRADHVDWQIWVADSDQPLPCKFVITTTDVAAAPQFAVEMRRWNLAPQLGNQTFEFVPPADAVKIDFMTLGKSGAAPR